MAQGAPEGVDLERLREYFAAHIEGASGGPLSAELIAGGRSNLTYFITDETSDEARTWVLRRPPLAHVLPTAHDMAREYRVQRALASTEVPVPRVLALCEDTDVNGAPFYVMEKVEGVIYRTSIDLTVLSVTEAQQCSDALIDVLARIHNVDFEAVGLGEFGRPEGFLERQVRRWGQQWERSKTRELPGVDELIKRLQASLPVSGPAAIVHGDYRLDNTMLSLDDPGHIVAVLDWEMSTLGDPLADLGLFLLYWGDPNAQLVATGDAIGGTPGFRTSDEVVQRYAELSGRPVDALDWYVVFAHYKLAIIVEGINARFKMGKTLGDGFQPMDGLVAGLIDAAIAVANRSPIPALRG